MNWPSDFPNKHTTIMDQPINYNYILGYLEQSMRTFHHILDVEGIVKSDSLKYDKVKALIDDVIKKAYESERSFSLSGTNR